MMTSANQLLVCKLIIVAFFEHLVNDAFALVIFDMNIVMVLWIQEMFFIIFMFDYELYYLLNYRVYIKYITQPANV